MNDFWDSVDKGQDCWIWRGASFFSHGNWYGQLTVDGSTVLAHRYAYLFINGSIPDGFVIDHLCRNGLCVRPDHLEAVPNAVNILRGEGAPARNARKEVCLRGHPLSGGNLSSRKNGRRECRECTNARQRSASKQKWANRKR